MGCHALKVHGVAISRIDGASVQYYEAFRDDGRTRDRELRAGDSQDPIADAKEILHDAAVSIENDVDAAPVRRADDAVDVGRIDVGQADLREIAHHVCTQGGRLNGRPVSVALGDQGLADGVVEGDGNTVARGPVANNAQVAEIVIHRYRGRGVVVISRPGGRVNEEWTAGECRYRECCQRYDEDQNEGCSTFGHASFSRSRPSGR